MGGACSIESKKERQKYERLEQRLSAEKALAAFSMGGKRMSLAASHTVGGALAVAADPVGTVKRIPRHLSRGMSAAIKIVPSYAPKQREARVSERANSLWERLSSHRSSDLIILNGLPKYTKLVQKVRLFAEMGLSEQEEAAKGSSLHRFKTGQIIYDEEEEGHDAWVVESGVVYASKQVWSVRDSNKKEWREMRTFKAGMCFGDRGLLKSEPRPLRMTARTDVLAMRIPGEVFVHCVRIKEHKENLMRKVSLFETMVDDQLAKLGALISKSTFSDGEVLASEGTPASCFYLIEEGEAVATSGGKEKGRYARGQIFAETCLLGDMKYEATLTASGDVVVYHLSRANLESKLGPLAALQAEQFEKDPRKLLSDFYKAGNSNGPAGVLAAQGGTPDPSLPSTSWFAVYRPCSRDSIAKMLGTTAVGKGLNIKGKSAKKNRLSGFVPFLQVSDNDHKSRIEESPKNARTHVYYRNVIARETAANALGHVMRSAAMREYGIEDSQIHLLTEYEPRAFGLDIPEPVLREAYIMLPDLSPMIGWETGRASEPAFMDMNLHSVRGDSTPSVCLYQHDLDDPMNPAGLLIAYAEKYVKPVCSDFDTFTVGSKGMSYAPVPPDQVDIINWSLENTAGLLASCPSDKGWMGRWLEILCRNARDPNGIHPDFGKLKYGFGDGTSYGLIDDVVKCTAACGAVRHGAECFNYYFPQDLDDEFLVVWDGYTNPPWRAVSEPELREFLIARAKDDYTFPLNPVWPVRDKGWYAVLEALKATAEGPANLKSWYPEQPLLERIAELHAQYPDGFTLKPKAAEPMAPPGMLGKPGNMKDLRKLKSAKSMLNALQDLSTNEMADFAVGYEVKREVQKRWARVRNSLKVEMMHKVNARKLAARNLATGKGQVKLEPLPTTSSPRE